MGPVTRDRQIERRKECRSRQVNHRTPIADRGKHAARRRRSQLVERTRSEEDGRHSIARITRKGLALLERIDPELTATFRELAGRIDEREAEMLSQLCEKLYEEDV